MVVRNREARIRREPPSASRSDRNGAKQRGEPLGVARKGGACRIVRSIRLRTASKERPVNAAFVAPAVAFAFNRQIAIRPQGRISIAIMLQRGGHTSGRLRPETPTSLNEPTRLRGVHRAGEGEFEGRGRRGPPHCTRWPLNAVSKCALEA